MTEPTRTRPGASLARLVLSVVILAIAFVQVVAPAQDGPSGAEADRTLEVLLSKPPDELEALSVMWWAGEKLEPLQLVVEARAGGSLLRIDVRCRGDAFLLVTSEGWTSRPVPITSSQCEAPEPLDLEWLPASVLHGEVSIPKGEILPRIGRLAIARCPTSENDDPEPLGVYPARFGKDQGWQADVPAGCLEVTLIVAPFAPVQWNGVRAPGGEVIRVPPAELVRGATLTVLVRAPESGHGIEGAVVSLVPEDDLESAAQAAYDGRAVPAERWRRTGVQGWARFEGVPPGFYHLIAQPPEGGSRSPGFSDEIELTVDDEVVVENLELPEPASLEIEVEPRSDLAGLVEGRLTAHATPYVGSHVVARSVRVIELDGESSERRSGVFEALVPGRWEVSLSWSPGKFYGSTLREEEILLLSGTKETLDFELTTAVFHGRVTFRGQPMTGSLDLRPIGTEHPRSSSRTDSDEEGRFTVMTEPGRYRVSFMSAAGGFSAIVPEVPFEDPEDRVEVKLPDGRIEGLVVDAEGAPVAGAWVLGEGMWPAERNSSEWPVSLEAGTHAGPDGRFILESLSEGTWTLVARSEPLESEPLVLDLAADEYLPAQRLVARETVPFEVGVVSESGLPIRGARGVVVLPPSAEGAVSSPHYVQTDVNGHFELRIRASLAGRTTTVAVGAPGHARTVLRMPLRRQMQIVLPQGAGRLEIVPEDSWSTRDRSRLALVAADGAGVQLHDLAAAGPFLATGVPLAGSDRSVVVPDLAPGTWWLIRLEGSLAEMVTLWLGQGRQLPELARFDILPGTATRIEISMDE